MLQSRLLLLLQIIALWYRTESVSGFSCVWLVGVAGALHHMCESTPQMVVSIAQASITSFINRISALWHENQLPRCMARCHRCSLAWWYRPCSILNFFLSMGGVGPTGGPLNPQKALSGPNRGFGRKGNLYGIWEKGGASKKVTVIYYVPPLPAVSVGVSPSSSGSLPQAQPGCH